MDNERYPYWPLPERPRLGWPHGARVAFWVIPNIEHFRFDGRFQDVPNPPLPDVSSYAQRDYGNRVGVWRLMDLLDKYGLRATVALNADVCRFEPQIVRAGMARNWEWMGHGITNSQRLTGLDPAQERETVRATVETITAFTGQAPKGWLGPGLGETYETPDVLAEHGIEYVCDWCADDQPFPLRVRQGRLISVPYTLELNDLPAFLRRNCTPEQFYRFICDQFDVLYEEGARSGRVMALALHPFVTGQPYRLKWLDHAFDYITRHKQVWLTTGGEIAAWYYAHYYDAAAK
jgi:peptidoglycan/xylan/chitin deacetylase (PgdA/CDA1 family)